MVNFAAFALALLLDPPTIDFNYEVVAPMGCGNIQEKTCSGLLSPAFLYGLRVYNYCPDVGWMTCTASVISSPSSEKLRVWGLGYDKNFRRDGWPLWEKTCTVKVMVPIIDFDLCDCVLVPENYVLVKVTYSEPPSSVPGCNDSLPF